MEFFSPKLRIKDGIKYAADYITVFSFYPIVPNAPFFYPLKTSGCFQGKEKGCIGSKWVNVETYWQMLSDDYIGITENMEHVNSILGAIWCSTI